ncbi:hypothetical protein EDB83DRAFT_2397829 [Lactarius deliciosus]|nr:hypothetical protein EDB83DRAFT_2397829 [Lactarius deliciosus]
MAHRRVLDRVPSPQADRLSVNTFPPLHQPRGHVQQRIANPHVVGDGQQDIHLEELEVLRLSQPLGNTAVQDEIQYPGPHHIDAPNYNPVHYYPPPPPHPEDPYVRVHQEGIAQGVPAQVHAFTPAAQENLDGHYGNGAQFPAADPPEAFHNIWPDPAPLANMLPVNGLRNLIGRNLNNPDTLINMVWIEPGPGGRVKLWIALELADIF